MLVAAMISALVGMSGGILVFFVLTFFMETKTAIPVHALLLLIANTSRLLFFHKSVDWRLLAYFSLLLVPGSLLGAWAFEAVNERLMEVGIGLVILFTCFVPLERLGLQVRWRHFVLIGFGAGFLSMIVGSVGPLLTPFFLNLGLPREELVASKSACQFVNQLTKIPTFYFMLSFPYADYLPMIGLATGATLIGTYLGGVLLRHLDEAAFKRLVKWILVGIAVKLIWG